MSRSDHDFAILVVVWPFEAKRKRSLAGLSTAARVDVTGTIVSANDVSSPVSELSAALIWIQLTETMSISTFEARRVAASGADLSLFDGTHVLGSVLLGDLLVVRTDDAIDVLLCPRRARVVFATTDRVERPDSTGPISTSPPALKSLLQRARGGQVSYREIGLSCGERVRLRAVVEPISHAAPTVYRSTAKPSFAVREDAGSVTLEEIPPHAG